ncbi:MAG: WG repeat-containing protein [Bacteroidaceae bacterium]|nr:WG repeat-containing protein [Bacteroidaceae bacterium]
MKQIMKQGWTVMTAILLTTAITVTACTQNKNNATTNTEQTEVTQDELEALAKALPKYGYVSNFHEGLAAVCDNETERWGFIDKMGNEVIPCKYQYIPCEFEGGVAIVCNPDDTRQIIDREGNVVAPFDYVYTGSGFCDGLIAFVKVNEMDGDEIDWAHFGKVGFIDTTGKVVIPADKFDVMMGEGPIIPDFSEGLCRQYDPENNSTKFFDKTGKVVFEVKGSSDDFHDGLVAVGKDISESEDDYMWRIGFVDKTGSETIPFTFNRVGQFSEDLCWAETDNTCGFINKNGKFELTGDWKTLVLFEDTEGQENLSPTFSDGLAWVCNQDGKFGYIDTKGNVVVPFRYEPGYDEPDGWYNQQPCYDFHNGIARVWDKATEKYGYIDREGKEVFSCQFTEAEDMSEGLARVRRNDNYGFIDAKGNCTLDIAQ